jgi:hypothetical protein
MNSKNTTTKRKPFRELLIISLIAITVIILFNPWACNHLKWAMMTPQERIEDTSASKNPIREDSIQLVSGKVQRSEFEDKYSASNWYSEFKANKVAFDKRYDEALMDITGTISRIKTDHGCSTIEIDAADKPFETIVFTNCPQGSDKWSDEVIKVVVGQQVHIAGIYSAILSSDSEMNLYKCHIKD